LIALPSSFDRPTINDQARTVAIQLLRAWGDHAAQWSTTKIGAIPSLAEHTGKYIRAKKPKIYSRELVDVIFEQPYCRIANLVDKKIAQRQAASSYLKELVNIGVLRERQVGREKFFIHLKLMQLLTRDSNQFAAYA
jgi:Fic family protein